MRIDPGRPSGHRPLRALAAFAFVGAAIAAFWLTDAQPWRWMDSAVHAGFIKIGIWVVPSVLAIMVLHRASAIGALSALGLTREPIAGLAFGLASTVPMGMAALATGLAHTSSDFLLGAAVLGPFAEEVLFRGVLFQELYKRARWPVGWATLASAVCFGAAHVTALSESSWWMWFAVFSPAVPGASPQVVALGHTVPFTASPELLLELLMPATAGAAFAWIVYRMESLWPAIALHAALNFWSVLSHGQDARAAQGADATSVAQGASIVLALLLAELSWRRRQGATPRLRPASLNGRDQ